MVRQGILILLLLTFINSGYATEQIDSLESTLSEIKQLKSDGESAQAYQQLRTTYSSAQSTTQQAELMVVWLAFMNEDKNWHEFDLLKDDVSQLLVSEVDIETKYALYDNLGLMKYRLGKFAEADSYLSKAVSFADDTQLATSMTYYLYGINSVRQGKMVDGLDKILHAHDLQINIQGYASPKILIGLGFTNYYMKNYDKAIEYTQQAIAAYPENDILLTELYANLAAMYVDKAQYQEALIAINQAEKVAHFHNIFDRVPIIINKGTIYAELNEHQKAIDYYLKALDIVNKNNDLIHKPTVLSNLAQSNQSLGNYKLAADYFEQALAIFSSESQLIKRLENYPPMIENYQSLGNYQRALELMVEYKELDDESTSLAAKEKFDQSQAAYDIASKEKSLIEAKLAQTSNENAILRLYGIVAFSLLIILFIYIAYRLKHSAYLQVKELALRDQLTGLFNRRALHDIFELEMSRVNRNKKTFSIILLDIDHFKVLNDTYGHDYGDIVLQKVASALQDSIRSMDKVARWGGEEFLVFLPETNKEQASHLAEKLRLAVSNIELTYQDKLLQVTVSLGVCEYNQQGEYKDMVKQADLGLYKAKETGRNKVVCLS
ncbi:MAG: diguanylate cyclase (GGDEF)-like protein [Pseudoalteromonas rhizosphaerae]|jgi:diguanylate cyclase (GGDEF)-like protein|uniref:tetratricopeptide repeat-containing diguanylate cyclase n=1 Tax=Pseudoalteromonas TaxID=53246 RepID=UPI001604690C|nr:MULTISPECIES: tetratricopeptide repeat-containing diguanylate cyclase [unclassified Pseudoalteromonas]MBB1416001.1 diguanylate cyclase [Pseudoalteromonas sp. SG44-1]MBB1478046.1 diguanylate cyclase [Pseudoalteromonas sp. SG41-2]MBB1504081.1 diguanylate cyclase [Pseudoalteromonas sp. SG41-1]